MTIRNQPRLIQNSNKLKIDCRNDDVRKAKYYKRTLTQTKRIADSLQKTPLNTHTTAVKTSRCLIDKKRHAADVKPLRSKTNTLTPTAAAIQANAASQMGANQRKQRTMNSER
jgi:hypothetical protein